MKKHLSILIALLLLPGLAFGAEIIEGVDYKGWECVLMKNATAEVYIAPQIAGRIIQYRVDGKDWLWVNDDLAGKVYPPEENDNMEVWKNYGGDKVWPAPQGWDDRSQWPGPGDPVITAPYEYEILSGKGKEVKLKLLGSDKGGYAGVRFIRELVLKDGSNRLDSRITMKNVSNREVSWGIWTVTQMDFSDQGEQKGDHDWNEEAYVALPMNKKSRWPEKYKVMFGLASSFNWQPDYDKSLLVVKFMNFVGKIVMDISDGWAAMADPQKGYTFVQRFDYDADAVYPDGGNYEVWVNGKGEFVHKHKRRYNKDNPEARYIEMEAMGPRVTLSPGEETVMETSWEVYKGGLESMPEYE